MVVLGYIKYIIHIINKRIKRLLVTTKKVLRSPAIWDLTRYLPQLRVEVILFGQC